MRGFRRIVTRATARKLQSLSELCGGNMAELLLPREAFGLVAGGVTPPKSVLRDRTARSAEPHLRRASSLPDQRHSLDLRPNRLTRHLPERSRRAPHQPSEQ